ncbi:MAG: zinc-dependent alcohol dehydrogenase family protein [Verrucomicrobiota bacterium]
MKALVFDQIGEPAGVLALRDLPKPAPGPGEVLVRIHLTPVHPTDLHVMRGRFGRRPELPASPGVEAVGVVEALGPGVAGPAPGTRVVLIDVWGTWREWVVSPADRVVPVPDGVSDEAAAQAIVNPVTAWVLTLVEHKLQPGDWLAQTAAGSTVGRLVLQLARAEGFRTISIVRRRAQVPDIAALGGDVVLCTEDDDWPAQLAQAAGGKAPAKAIDCVSGRVAATVARSLAPGGRLIVFGALSSHRQTDPASFEIPVFVPRLLYGATTLQGWFLFHWLVATPLGDCAAVVRSVLQRLDSGALRLAPATLYAPDQRETALREAEASAREGKPLFDFR